MQKLRIIIERAEKNYSAYIYGFDGIAVSGKSITEIKEKMKGAVCAYVDACKDFGFEVPPELNSDYEMSFEMDTQTLLDYYAGILGKPALEKITGINAKQLWHYAMGISSPREAQKDKIRKGLRNLGEELLMIEI